jgi:hypothetical protein
VIYAQVDASDPRRASRQGLGQPPLDARRESGMGQEGLYYFFNVLTKSLCRRGRRNADAARRPHDRLARGSRAQADRAAEARRLLVNENNRWWEADPTS